MDTFVKGDDLRKDKLVTDGAGYTPINIPGAAAEQKLRSASGIYTRTTSQTTMHVKRH